MGERLPFSILFQAFLNYTALPLWTNLRPARTGKSWQVLEQQYGTNWACLLIERPTNPGMPMPLCFVKKLDRWYITVWPVGDAEGAIPFLKD